MGSRGALTDLTPYLKKQNKTDPNRIDLQDYYPFTLDEATYRKPGTTGYAGLYGIPTGVDIRLLYSNANQLKQQGLVDAKGNPRPPTTWSELAADAKLLSRYRSDGSMTRLGFGPNYGNSWLYLYAFQAGGNLLNADGTKVTLASPEVQRALRYMTDIYDNLGGAREVNGFQASFQAGALSRFFRV